MTRLRKEALKGLLIDSLFNRPVDCPHGFTIDHPVSLKQ